MDVGVRVGPAGPPQVRRPTGTRRFGQGVAVTVGVLTLVTFALALTALPDKVPYPFDDPVIVEQWPGDYLWMVPAMLLVVLVVALVAVLHERTLPERRAFSLVALVLATVAATVLLLDYYVQLTVMPLALERGELEGWALFTQYNPAGVFIALEELGYLLLSLSLLSLVPALTRTSWAERVVRWLFLASAAAVAVSLGVVLALQGRGRGDVFEILVISIVWLTLIVAAPLLAVALRRPSTPDAAP